MQRHPFFVAEAPEATKKDTAESGYHFVPGKNFVAPQLT
ncbi:hypothetical protein FIC_01441 [Flavobacteriaceae bacterium 3519-10]|nr:hypothetical protein FIC_01441 [Flavobacteriaceae bacterium 3519-10]